MSTGTEKSKSFPDKQKRKAEASLPWRTLDGPPVTASLLFVSARGRSLNRFHFNRSVWRPALISAGVPLGRENGMHALRHFYASVLLDAGESITGSGLPEPRGHRRRPRDGP